MFIDIMAKLECYRLVHMNDASISTRKSMCALNREDTSSLPHIRESGIQQFFCCWNLESRGLESGINGLESGIHYGMESRIHYGMDSGIQKAGIQRPGSGIQDLRGFSYMGQSSCVQALVTCSCAWVFLVHTHIFFLCLCLCLCQTCELALWTKFAVRTSLFFFIQENVTGVHTLGTMYGCLET